jgi:hypothetical protein
MKDIFSAEISFFRNLKAQGKNMPIRCMIEGIRKGSWSRLVAAVRACDKHTAEHEKAKKRLPRFLPSATTNGGADKAALKHHSGLLQIDLDGVGRSEAPDLRDRIGEDRHIAAAFISASGDGVKCLMRVPADFDLHGAAFKEATDYIREKYGFTIDQQCSAQNHPCFISHDPEIKINAEAVPLPVRLSGRKAGKPLQGLGGGFVSVLSNKSPLRNNSEAKPAFHDPLFLRHLQAQDLFRRLIVDRFGKPVKGHRNELLTKHIVPTCFFALAPDVVKIFAMEFRMQHAEVFADYSLSDYERHVEIELLHLEESFRRELSPMELQKYEALEKAEERHTFRICRSLARCESDPQYPPPTYYLAARNLAARLDSSFPNNAWRNSETLIKAGILKATKRGKPHSPGEKGVTNVYRWLLPTLPLSE